MTLDFHGVDAGFIKRTPLRMEGFAVTCQLAPSTSHLISSSCSSPRQFTLGFLQTPPRDDALALPLTFGSANTWYRDFHPTSLVPCPAHTRNEAVRLTRPPSVHCSVSTRLQAQTTELPFPL